MAYDKHHPICLSLVFSMFTDSLVATDISGYSYRITLNYGQSCINTWSHLVAGKNSIINAGSRVNARSFVGSQYLHGTSKPFLSLFSQYNNRRQPVDNRAPRV